jgi:K+-sensing histidine kinase KdpD
MPPLNQTCRWQPVSSRGEAEVLTLTAHQLRTPLNDLLGTSEFLFGEIQNRSRDVDWQQLYNSFRQRLLNLLGNLDHVILLTDMQAKAPHFAHNTSSLDDVLEVVQQEVARFAVPYEVKITPPPAGLGPVGGDWFFLKKALSCLLETAVKFCLPGGEVQIQGQSFPEEVRLTMESRGLSLSKTDLARFFDLSMPFTAEMPAGDLGLAPAVAKRIITLLGGTVQIQNVKPAGVRFDLILPRRYLPGNNPLG